MYIFNSNVHLRSAAGRDSVVAGKYSVVQIVLQGLDFFLHRCCVMIFLYTDVSLHHLDKMHQKTRVLKKNA